MSGKQAKPRLSKGILEMKFMQRTKAKVDKEIEAAEGRAMYSSEITEKMLRSGSNFIIEPSFSHCEGLLEGRLSFRGMNPEIERLLELEQAEREAAKRGDDQKVEVSDKEMAAFYHAQQAPAATKIMQKKFQKNNNNNHNSNNHIQSNNSNQKNSRKRPSIENGFPRGKKLKNYQKPRDDDDDDNNDV